MKIFLFNWISLSGRFLKKKVYLLPIDLKEQLSDQILSEQYLAAIQAVNTTCNICITARGQRFEQYLL